MSSDYFYLSVGLYYATRHLVAGFRTAPLTVRMFLHERNLSQKSTHQVINHTVL